MKSEARFRVENIARKLAKYWSLFLVYIIAAQGFGSGIVLPIFGWEFWLVLPFHLRTPEFIAVVTTTTASVFGFLVIIATNLFRQNGKKAKKG